MDMVEFGHVIMYYMRYDSLAIRMERKGILIYVDYIDRVPF